jgi:hypothetical protein
VSKRRPDPMTSPDPPPSTFKALDLCDGAGTRLAPGDRLSGLCPTCQGANTAPGQTSKTGHIKKGRNYP